MAADDRRREARRERRRGRLDTPREPRSVVPRPRYDPEDFGQGAESFARFMGTARFLVYMTVVVIAWLSWNTWAPEDLQFDPRDLNYTLLTLILSLQASYAAPLILLAQNRQADRDRVQLEEDRGQNERSIADTEYLTREIAALRIAMGEVATRDFVRSELQRLLEEGGLRPDGRAEARPEARNEARPDGPAEPAAHEG